MTTRRTALFGILLCGAITLAGCSAAGFDYDFKPTDAAGEWYALDHPSASIDFNDDGSFEAHDLPSSLCEADRPVKVSDLDWDDSPSFDGGWKVFKDTPYSGSLSPVAQDCNSIPIYFQRESNGMASMIIYLVAEEDAPLDSILRFIKAEE